jgi:sortase A
MRTVLRSLAELSITAGLIIALFVGYLSWGTGEYTHRQQGDLHDELERQWNAARTRKLAATRRDAGPGRTGKAAVPAIADGGAYARIRVPKFGPSYRYTVVQGVGVEDLRKGPGHYPGTAGPGEVGNMAIAGHRTTYGGPFGRNGELARGDEILIDTAATTFVYTVTKHIVVRPGRTDVTAPVPGKPGRAPRRAMLTLTTCHPKFSAAYRLVVFAELAGRRPRATGA